MDGGANPLDALRAIGKSAGIEESKIDGCMTDDKQDSSESPPHTRKRWTRSASTPRRASSINGTKFAGALPFDDLISGDTKVQGLASIIRELLPQ